MGRWCSKGEVGPCLSSCRLWASVMSSGPLCSSNVCPGDGRGENECDDTRFRMRLSRWPIRVLAGSGDSASSCVPEFDRDKIRGDRTEGERDIGCCSTGDCCKVEFERLMPTLSLLSIDTLFEWRRLPIKGAAISSLTGAGTSSELQSRAAPGDAGTVNSSSSGRSAVSRCLAHSFVR